MNVSPYYIGVGEDIKIAERLCAKKCTCIYVIYIIGYKIKLIDGGTLCLMKEIILKMII